MPEHPDADVDALEDDLTDSVPRIEPVYADEVFRDLGERLVALYELRDANPSSEEAARHTEEIARVAGRMRRGPRLHAGEFLADGRYWLIDTLSSKGANAHWKAWDRRTGRFAFLTVFHDAWTEDDAAVRNFQARGRKLVALEHPHIGKVFEAVRSIEGWVYVAQEFFPSGNLKGLVADAARRGFDAFAATQLLLEVAEGLRHAHDANLVHGEVQPANVMLSDDGAAHLVDFSVGPSTQAWGSLYAAPETSERGYVPAPAADVYGLAMTALFALHRGDLPVWVLRDPGRLIESLDAPDHVKRVLGKATEWDLDRRYPDVRTLLRELMGDPELVRILADRALERGRLDVGALHFEKLLKTQPHRGVEYRTILGDVYSRMGAFDQAHEHLAAAMERSPDPAALFPPLRQVAQRTQKWPRLAELLWSQARQRDSGRRVVLRSELARINEVELDDPASAAEVWGQVLSEHRLPEQAREALTALMRLAGARADAGGPDATDAAREFVAHGQELLLYVEDDDARASVEYAIGRTLITRLDDVEGGLPWIDRAEAKGYSELALAPVLEQIRADRGQWRRVIQLMVAQARQQDISDASPTLLRAGIIAGAVHLEEEAFEVYHSLLERAPRHVVALRHLARMHHRARQPERALPFYERLWDTYKGRDTDEPEASERAADCTAYASILLRQGQASEAAERLQEALRLTPYHVPALQLAGPLFLGRGDTQAASDVFERLLRAFKSVERAPQKVEACLGMGDLTWIQGRLTAAMGWYNRAIELEPFSVRAWWGLAKVALSSRGGHPGADRAPWVRAVPRRFTAVEGLARLLVGLLDEPSMTRWLALSPLGRAIVEAGTSPTRLACGVADVMVRNEMVGSDLFQRLSDAFPDWAEPIDEARRMWQQPVGYPLHTVYGWSSRVLDGRDFDLDAERAVLPHDPHGNWVGHDDLGGPSAWRELFSGELPPAPRPITVIEEPSAVDDARIGPVGALVRDATVWLTLPREVDEVRIGRRPGSDLRIVHDEAVILDHGRLFRRAGRVYLEALPGARIQVDGEDRSLWRLVGGERVTLGETRLHYHAVEDEAQLPPKRREPPRIEDIDPESTVGVGAELTAELVQAAILEAEAARGEAHAEPDVSGEREREEADEGDDDDMPTRLLEAEAPVEPEPVAAIAPEAVPVGASEVEAEVEAAPEVEAEAEVEADAVAAPEAEVEAAPVAPPEVVEGDPELEPYSAEAPLPEPAALPEVPVAEAPFAPAEEFVTGPTEIERSDATPEGSEVDENLSPSTDPEAPFPCAEDEEDDEVVQPAPAPAPRAPPPTPVPEPLDADEGQTFIDEEDDDDDLLEPPAWVAPEVSDEAPPVREPPVRERANPTLVAEVETPEPAPRRDDVSTFGFPDSGDDDDDLDSPPPRLPTGVVMGGGRADSAPPAPLRTAPTAPRVQAPPPVAPGPRAVLEFMSGADRGSQVDVGLTLTVGQSKHCGMSIPGDTRLSPVHCKVERTQMGFKLVDEGSANGTVVNGARITEVDLAGGEVIMVGRTVLRFRVLEEA